MIIQVNICTPRFFCTYVPSFSVYQVYPCKIVFDIWIYFQQLLFYRPKSMKIILISLHNKLNEIELRTLYTWLSLNNLILLSFDPFC